MDTVYEYYYEYYIFTNIFYGVSTLSRYVPIYPSDPCMYCTYFGTAQIVGMV
jgi:hypothetical protein